MWLSTVCARLCARLCILFSLTEAGRPRTRFCFIGKCFLEFLGISSIFIFFSKDLLLTAFAQNPSPALVLHSDYLRSTFRYNAFVRLYDPAYPPPTHPEALLSKFLNRLENESLVKLKHAHNGIAFYYCSYPLLRQFQWLNRILGKVNKLIHCWKILSAWYIEWEQNIAVFLEDKNYGWNTTLCEPSVSVLILMNIKPPSLVYFRWKAVRIEVWRKIMDRGLWKYKVVLCKCAEMQEMYKRTWGYQYRDSAMHMHPRACWRIAQCVHFSLVN